MTDRGAEKDVVARLLIAPGFLLVLGFLGVPTLALVLLAWTPRGSYGALEFSFSVENFARLVGFGSFGFSSANGIVLVRTLVYSFATTLLCLGIGFPLALSLRGKTATTRRLLLALLFIPGCTNLVIRTTAWMLVLEPLGLYPSRTAVLIGLSSAFLPFAVFPLSMAAERIDPALVDAARDLSASRLRLFRHAVLPPMIPGIVVAATLTFIPCLGTYVVSDVLGGGKETLLGNFIAQQFGSAQDYPFGAVLALSLALLSAFVLLAVGRASKAGEGRLDD